MFLKPATALLHSYTSLKCNPIFFRISFFVSEQLICNVKGCGRSFASLGHMRNHQLMHEKEKALECHYKGCGRKFSWPAHLFHTKYTMIHYMIRR
jgi:uncharacterized Zn-finger protein